MAVPAFKLHNQKGESKDQSMFAKGRFVLYAYPADFTPGCTVEAQDFARLYPEFQAAGYDIVGISPDGQEKHAKFCVAESLPFDLLSDPDFALMKALDAYGEKTMYGKKVTGVKRSTFIIEDGQVVRTFANVKAKGHAEKVLASVR